MCVLAVIYHIITAIYICTSTIYKCYIKTTTAVPVWFMEIPDGVRVSLLVFDVLRKIILLRLYHYYEDIKCVCVCVCVFVCGVCVFVCMPRCLCVYLNITCLLL